MLRCHLVHRVHQVYLVCRLNIEEYALRAPYFVELLSQTYSCQKLPLQSKLAVFLILLRLHLFLFAMSFSNLPMHYHMNAMHSVLIIRAAQCMPPGCYCAAAWAGSLHCDFTANECF